MRTSHAITVPVAPTTVFAFLSDVSNETQWRQSIVGSRYTTGTSPQIGVDGETDVSMGSKALTMRWTVVEFTDGHHVAWRLDGDPWHGGGSYTTTPAGGGTRIRATLEVRLAGAARIFEPVIGLQLRRGLRKDLDRLGALLPSIAG